MAPGIQERERRKLKMPEIVGLLERDAKVLLKSAGFTNARVKFLESYQDVGVVVHQHPLKGQIVDSNAPVTLSVCKRSYIHFLPQIYQLDAALGQPFLREFLWVFQHINDSISSKLDDGHRYFNPLDAPPEFLPWLASWVALTLDVDWPDEKKRTLVRKAAQMYRYRGTKRALIEMLEIFIGKRPRITENKWPYSGFRVGVTSSMGEDTIVLPPINLDHCFMVHIPIAPEDVTEEVVVKIHNIITQEKPAHATYFLQFKTEVVKAKPQVFMQIGLHATIGMTELRYDEATPETPDTESKSSEPDKE